MTVYQPSDQEGWGGRLFVRAAGDPYALVPIITRTIHEMASDQPVERASTLEDIRAEVLTPNRLNVIVFGGFAGVALLISVVGVAGVLAFSVSGRAREFGIRMALGAQSADVLRMVMRDALKITVAGVAAGLLLAEALTRWLAALLFGVQPHDLVTFVGSAALLISALAWAPYGLTHWPRHVAANGVASIVVLGLICTALAFVVFFALIVALAGALLRLRQRTHWNDAGGVA